MIGRIISVIKNKYMEDTTETTVELTPETVEETVVEETNETDCTNCTDEVADCSVCHKGDKALVL
jgi:hypothetical protein